MIILLTRSIFFPLVFCFVFLTVSYAQLPDSPTSLGVQGNELPYYDEIMAVINSIEYSGYQTLVNSTVDLKMDFPQRKWGLKNVHHYDEQGRIILEENKYGQCAELSTYLYEMIRPKISDRYDIKFAMVAEARYFPTSEFNHIVLLMVDKETKEGYLIDPSLRRYGRVKDLSSYEILVIKDALSFVQEKSSDISFSVNEGMPIFIRHGLLLFFSITEIHGKFDKDNFLLVLSTYRNKTDGKDILAGGRKEGKLQSYADKSEIEQILTQEEIDILINRIDSWLTQN